MSSTQLTMFTSTWNSIVSRFESTALDGYKEQAVADSEQWIQTRLLKAMEGVQIDKKFMTLFQH